MKRIFLASVAVLSLVSSALATDLPVYKATVGPVVVPAFSWTGLYVGGNIGYGWAAHSFDITGADPNSQNFFALLGNPGSLDQTTKGVVGGFQTGYNMQFGSWVLGAEFLFDWTNMNSSGGQMATIGAVPVAQVSSGVRVDWDGAINARIGYTPWSNWMVALFGGFAFGNISDNAAVTCLIACGPFGFSNGSSNTHIGWDAGAEIKYALTSHIITGFRYRYVDLGNQSLFISTGGAPPITFNGATSARWNEAMFTLDYKF